MYVLPMSRKKYIRGICSAATDQNTMEENRNTPIVSVIMPAYKCSGLLRESVASVQAQTVQEWELLIVDDCSPDDTYETACKLASQDGRIRAFQTPGNAGPGEARNIALSNARGKYTAFLDSDDLWLPEKLERQIDFMEEKDARFSCTAYDRVDESGELLGRVWPFPEADYRKVLYTGNPVGNSTAMYLREGLEDLRVPPIRKRNDFALWLKILHTVPRVYGLQEPLAVYRVRKTSVSSNKRRLISYQWKLYREIERLSMVRSALAMAGVFWCKLTHPTWHEHT